MSKYILIVTSVLLTACGGDFVVKADKSSFRNGVCLYQEREYGFNPIDAILVMFPIVLNQIKCEPYSIETFRKLKKEAKELNDD